MTEIGSEDGGDEMANAASDAYRRELQVLEVRKRRVYAVAACAGIAVLLLSWVTREPTDVVLTVTYPILAVVLLVFTVASLRRWLPLTVLERGVLVLVGALVLGRLAWHLHLAGPIDEHLLVLVGGHYWSVGALIVGGFVLLERRPGMWFGIGTLLVSVTLVATGAGPQLVGPDAHQPALLYLARVHGFLVLLLVLTMAVATLREQLHQALTRAQTLEELAVTDPLTGVGNRRAALQVLEREADAHARYGRPLSVIMVDVDRFKRVNDTHGHQRGDEVLGDVGRVLQQSARVTDVVARWGGEEFLIIAPETGGEQAAELAERCRSAVVEAQPGGLDVTATFGVEEFTTGDDPDSVVRRADERLYGAKRDGRDRVASQTTVS